MAKTSGCAFGRESRVMIENIHASVQEIKTAQKEGFSGIDTKMTELFNHQSDRWPPGAATAVGIVAALLGAVCTIVVTKIIG